MNNFSVTENFTEITMLALKLTVEQVKIILLLQFQGEFCILFYSEKI